MTDTELKLKAFQILHNHLGIVEMEKFIALVQQEPFDYTQWRENLLCNASVEELNRLAMHHRKNLHSQ